ncbi:hypothetical protein Dimus_014706 [Dionaea muscipula]
MSLKKNFDWIRVVSSSAVDGDERETNKAPSTLEAIGLCAVTEDVPGRGRSESAPTSRQRRTEIHRRCAGKPMLRGLDRADSTTPTIGDIDRREQTLSRGQCTSRTIVSSSSPCGVVSPIVMVTELMEAKRKSWESSGMYGSELRPTSSYRDGKLIGCLFDGSNRAEPGSTGLGLTP